MGESEHCACYPGVNSIAIALILVIQNSLKCLCFTYSGVVLKPTSSVKTKYYSATFHKGYKLFSGIRVHGERTALQGPESDVQLHIPEGFYGFISGHTHTDLTPFLGYIPESECLVSPIAEYNCFPSGTYSGLFEIKIPHCVQDRKQFQHIRVRHGDVHKNTPFYEKCTFTVDEEYITVQTSKFSQFICTVAGCQETRCGNPKAFIFGRITPLRYPPIKSALRIYMCSPLYNIRDFKEVEIYFYLDVYIYHIS